MQGQLIKKRSVEQYLQLIGNFFASVGANIPCHNRMGNLDFCLGRQLVSYNREDYLPTIAWPLPVIIIQFLDTVAQVTTTRNITISNLTWVASFFLLRPGKYCKGGTNTAQNPFRIKDFQFSFRQQPYNASTVSNAVLVQAGFVRLLFTTQNNGVKGESIGHRRTGHPQGCPVASICRQVAYL